MKPKNYFFICVALVAIFSFAGCKKQLVDDPDAINPFKKDESTITVGANNKLIVKVKLWVKSSAFTYSGKYMIIKSSEGLKAIVFMYNNPANLDDIDDKAPAYLMTIDTVIDNRDNWVYNKDVRLMCLNEDNITEFYGLEDYFLQRLKKYQYDLKSPSKYDEFNEIWNNEHSYNQVSFKNKILIDKKPRFTKDDGMLTLKKI